MKKVIVIFLCLQILSDNSFATELMKIPFLFQHYSSHSTQEHQGEGFGDYLWEHYVDSADAHDCQDHCEDDLPFKDCDDCSHAVSVVLYVVPETNQIEVQLPSSYSTAQFGLENQFISVYDCCIWQPPKIG